MAELEALPQDHPLRKALNAIAQTAHDMGVEEGETSVISPQRTLDALTGKKTP